MYEHHNQDLDGTNFFKLPSQIPLTRSGDFSLLKNLELTYSTRSLHTVRFTLIILVGLMIIVALISTIFMVISKELNFDNSQVITQVICLWGFPLVIYAYFSWLYMIRSKYKIILTQDGLTYQRLSGTEFFSHSEILTALETKPILRNRIGVWLPTKGKMRILLSEVDTLPGRPFVEELLAFYNCPMPRDPYGTDRNTYSALGFSLLFLVCPFFIWSGYINDNINALHYSYYIVGVVFFIGIVLLFISNHTTRAYKNDPEFNEDETEDMWYIENEEDENEVDDETGNNNREN